MVVRDEGREWGVDADERGMVKTWISPELEESQWILTQTIDERLQLTNMPAERKIKCPGKCLRCGK